MGRKKPGSKEGGGREGSSGLFFLNIQIPICFKFRRYFKPFFLKVN